MSFQVDFIKIVVQTRLTNLLEAKNFISSKTCRRRASESTKLVTRTIWVVSNTLNIIKRDITKRNILINTNRTSLSLSLLLQQMQKKIKLRQRFASETKKTNRNNKFDFSKRLNSTSW